MSYSVVAAARRQSPRFPVIQAVIVAIICFCVCFQLWAVQKVSTQKDLGTENIFTREAEPAVRQASIKGRQSPKKSHTFTVGICALVLDAEAYLTEWIDYHLQGLEFEDIYIYDNSPNFDQGGWYQNTRSHPIYSRVQVKHWPGKGWVNDDDGSLSVQVSAYEDCVKLYGKSNDYLAMIDVDEFIVLMQYPKKQSTIHDVIEDYLAPFGGALTMNWMLVGTSNKTVYSPLPVLKRFQYLDPSPHNVVKTIVKTSDYEYMRNEHSARVRNGTTVHTTLYPGAVHKEQTSKTGASDHTYPSGIVLLYHYRFLSIKEYTAKRCVRGEAIGIVKGCNEQTGKLHDDVPEHVIHRPGSVRNTKAWEFLKRKVPKYRVFDQGGFEDLT